MMLFKPTANAVMFVSRPIELGIGPVMQLLNNTISCNDAR